MLLPTGSRMACLCALRGDLSLGRVTRSAVCLAGSIRPIVLRQSFISISAHARQRAAAPVVETGMPCNMAICADKPIGHYVPMTHAGRLISAVWSLRMVFYAANAWLGVIVNRLFSKHPLDWPIDLEIFSAGFKACLVHGKLSDSRVLLGVMSWCPPGLFYPGLCIERTDAAGCKAYWISTRAGRRREMSTKESPQVVLFYVHGGGFVAGDALMTARTFGNWLTRLAKQGVHAKVLTIEYPLAPEHPYPEPVIAVAGSLAWLMKQLAGSNSQVIGVADSAGANILVSAMAALRDYGAQQQQQEQGQAAAVLEHKTSSSILPSTGIEPVGVAGSNEVRNGLNHTSMAAGAPPPGSAVAAEARAALFAGIHEQVTLLGTNSSTATAYTTRFSSHGVVSSSFKYTPPSAVVLVSPAADISETACFHDRAWVATHESR
eukprot:GHRR01000201.1.p1 GENE.GHRR01000201.1~~GHRR01000201.1.p1  ORF type:complete len:434 (+),score=85.35 GHRR01000201.1:887-2188(+)